MKFTKAQRRWIRAAFYDMAAAWTVDVEQESRDMYRMFSRMLSRKRRAAWRTAGEPKEPPR